MADAIHSWKASNRLESVLGVELRNLSGELHGPCPLCGEGDDRLWLYADNARAKCRRCDFDGDSLAWAVELSCHSSIPEFLRAEGALSNRNGSNGDGRKPKAPARHATPQAAAEAALRAIRRDCDAACIAGEWPYTDAEGNDVARVFRINTPGRKRPKEFRPVRRDGWGWCLGDPPGQWPLFRLPAILADTSATVFVHEGERKAEMAAAVGLVSTAPAHGAASPHKTDWRPLAGRRVVILADNDEPGERFARDVARRLGELGCDVRIVRLPGLPPKGDVVEFLASRREAGATDAAIRAEVEALAAAAPVAEDLAPGLAEESESPASHFDAELMRGTEQDFADRFVAKHKHAVRYVALRKTWYTHCGPIWIPGDEGVVRRAQDVARDLRREAAEAAADAELHPKDAAREKLAAEKRKASRLFLSEKPLKAALRLASCAAEVQATPDDFDADDLLLNLPNGTLDLRCDLPRLRPHDPADMMTRCANAEYDPDAKCPAYLSFLERVQPDPDLRAYIQRRAGLSLSGLNVEHDVVFNVGIGQNGKNTDDEARAHVLGNYAGAVPESLFLEQRIERHPCDAVMLFRLRMAHADELPEGGKVAENRLKALTGGADVVARGMRENFWAFRATHKLSVRTNHLPRISGTDLGIWRRVRVVEWLIVIPSGERDKGLAAKLRAEASGILNWMIAGWLDFRRLGDLAPPDAVLRATRQYREDEDTLADFIAAHVVPSVGGFVSSADLHRAHVAWAETEGCKPFGKNALTKRLKERGFETGHNSARTTRGVRGVCLQGQVAT
ncbi:MAG: phage/plasmid primase, P4 family [Planctomycetota bacterium]